MLGAFSKCQMHSACFPVLFSPDSPPLFRTCIGVLCCPSRQRPRKRASSGLGTAVKTITHSTLRYLNFWSRIQCIGFHAAQIRNMLEPSIEGFGTTSLAKESVGWGYNNRQTHIIVGHPLLRVMFYSPGVRLHRIP